MAKLSSSMPKGHGLGPAVRRLSQGDPVVALVVLRRQKRVEDYEKGDTELYVKVTEIEAIHVDDLYLAKRLMERALEARTGQPTLPYDLERALEGVFEGLDLEYPQEPPAAQELPLQPEEKEPEPTRVCDHCGKAVEKDGNGLWCDFTGSYLCGNNDAGHDVGGEQ